MYWNFLFGKITYHTKRKTGSLATVLETDCFFVVLRFKCDCRALVHVHIFEDPELEVRY